MLTTAIFPNRYVQGAGALSALGEEAARLGKRALVLLDGFVARTLADPIAAAMAGHVATVNEVFAGECCDAEIDRLSAVVAKGGVDVVVGVGGGKTLDTAKAVAHAGKLPVVIVPTLASTDAPCSALSVIYTEKGEFARYLLLPKKPRRGAGRHGRGCQGAGALPGVGQWATPCPPGSRRKAAASPAPAI